MSTPGADKGRSQFPGRRRRRGLASQFAILSARSLRSMMVQRRGAARVVPRHPARQPARCVPLVMPEDFGELTEKGLRLVRGFLQMRRRPAGRRRRIIQFVRQTRRHGAERGQLFPLLGVAFQVAHLAGRGLKNLSEPPHGIVLNIRQKFSSLKPEQSGRLCHASRGRPGNVQQQRDLRPCNDQA